MVHSQEKNITTSPRNYAFLGASFFTEIQITLWQGALKAANELGVNLLCFPVNSLSTTVDYIAQSNILIDFVSDQRVDGLVIWAAGLLGNDNHEDIETVFKRFKSIPLVTIGGSVQDFPDLSTSNFHGTQEAVQHLVRVHKYQHFGIIRGPLNHPEANTRHDACMEALQQFGIELEPAQIALGAFDLPLGANLAREAVAKWIRNGTVLDCVIVATDYMALAVMEEIKKQGLRVPEDIAVVGFDNLLEGRASNPPLTSVQNPFYELGYQATKMLDDMIVNTNTTPKSSLLPARLIVRESCGCKSSSISLADSPMQLGEEDQLHFAESIDETLLHTLMDLTHSVKLPQDHLEGLIRACIHDMQGNTPPSFLIHVKESILNFGKAHMNLMVWQDMITVLHQYVLSNSAGHIGIQREAIFHKARLILAEVSQNILITQHVIYERQMSRLNTASTELITSFESSLPLDAIQQELLNFGIPSFYLSLYVNPKNPVEGSRLVLAYEQGNRIDVPPEGIVFPSANLAPSFLIPSQRTKSMVVEPLYFRERQLGILLLEAMPKLSTEFESLRTYISSALRGAQLVQESQQYNLELKQANEELKTFTYTVAHDLRTPLRSANGFSQILLKDYADNLDDEGKHYLDRIRKATVRMGILIDDLLEFSRVTKHKLQLQNTDLSAMAQQILSDFKERVPDRHVTYIVQDEMLIRADGGLMRIMVENLLNNAWKFTSKQADARIEFGCYKSDDDVVFYVQDNGVGYDMTFYDKIFLPFERLHKEDMFEGTGIGLATVQRIIQRHGGRVWAESDEGLGTTFFFTIDT